MNKIIIYGADKTRTEMLALELGKKYQLETTVYHDLVSLQRLLKQDEISLSGLIVLSDNKSDENLEFAFKEIKSMPPYIIEANVSDLISGEKGHSFFSSLGIERIRSEDNDFFAIHFYDFMTFTVAPCDIYLRMGPVNHVKIINAHEIYTHEILERYRKKHIKQLYIKKSDSKAYLRDLYDSVNDQFECASSVSSKIVSGIAGLDYVNCAMREIGVDQTSLDIANKTIASVLDTINSQPDIYKKMKEYLSVNSYLAEHSIATAALSCAIARNLKLSNQFTIKKLVTAALFHDISLKDCELSVIVNTDSKEYSDISDEKKKEFSEHIYASIDFLNKVPGIPANIETIILEHHERPNGKGFPRGLDSFTITPLGCVFIIAETFVHHLFRLGFNTKNRDSVLEEMSKEFNSGHFKEPMRDLLKIFL